MSTFPPAPPPRSEPSRPDVRPNLPPRSDPEPTAGRGRAIAWLAALVVLALVVASVVTVVAMRGGGSDRAGEDDAAGASSTPSTSATSSPSTNASPTPVDPVFDRAEIRSSGLTVYTMTPALLENLVPCHIQAFRGYGAYATDCAALPRMTLFAVALHNVSRKAQTFRLEDLTFTAADGRTFEPVDMRPFFREAAIPPRSRVKPSEWATGWIGFDTRTPDILGTSLAFGTHGRVKVWFQGDRTIEYA